MLNMVQMLPFIYPWITVPPKLYVKGEYYWNVNYEWYYWLITANPFLRFPGIEEKKLFFMAERHYSKTKYPFMTYMKQGSFREAAKKVVYLVASNRGWG